MRITPHCFVSSQCGTWIFSTLPFEIVSKFSARKTQEMESWMPLDSILNLLPLTLTKTNSGLIGSTSTQPSKSIYVLLYCVLDSCHSSLSSPPYSQYREVILGNPTPPASTGIATTQIMFIDHPQATHQLMSLNILDCKRHRRKFIPQINNRVSIA